MKTRLFTHDDIAQIIKIIKDGGIVAFPTDTVYGLAARYDRKEAYDLLKQAKQRPHTKPFPMLVESLEQIEMVAELNQRDRLLIKRWMPGAITLVFNKKKTIADYVTNGLDTIAIRMPDDQFVLSIIKGVGIPLLVPSANISSLTPALTHQEVLEQLDGTINGVVMGQCANGVPSTIISTIDDKLKVLRQGPINLEDIERALEDATCKTKN